MINPAKIVVATLQNDRLSPFSPGRENEAEDSEGLPFPVRIDVDGLGQRVTALPIEDSNYSDLLALKGKLIYQSEPAKGEASTKLFDMGEKKETLLMKEAWSYSPAAQADRLVYRSGGAIGILFDPCGSRSRGRRDRSLRSEDDDRLPKRVAANIRRGLAHPAGFLL